MESLVEYGIKNILAIDDVFYTITMETKVSTLDDHTIDIFDSINDFNDEFNEFVQDNVDGSFADFFKQENVVGTDALRKINENQQESYRQLRGVRDLNFIECIPEIKVIEEALDTDLSYVSELGYEIYKEKRYKTNKHVFLRIGE